jgi:inner membrane protein
MNCIIDYCCIYHQGGVESRGRNCHLFGTLIFIHLLSEARDYAHPYTFGISGGKVHVDSLTHGLLAFFLFSSAGIPGALLPVVIIGAVLPDIDILFKRISDHNPRLFVFTHGGFTHSVIGLITLTTILTAITVILSDRGITVPGTGIAVMLSLLTGSLLHVFLDILAYPGIPILYPLSERKYTLGIFPGPSLFLMVMTLTYLALVYLGIQDLAHPLLYLSIVVGFVAFRTVLKVFMVLTQKGTTIPRINPLDWLIVSESGTTYSLYLHRITGVSTLLGIFPRYKHISREELEPYEDLPEVKRHRFYSYLSTVEGHGKVIRFHDPVRENRYVFYPPDYISLEIQRNCDREDS